MGIFRPETRSVFGAGTYNPFENPSVPLSSVALDSVYGLLNSTDSGESVTVDTAIGLPVVYRCVSLLSTVIAGCPLVVYRNPGKKDVTSLTPVLSQDNPNTLYTQYELWELVVSHIALWGNAYVLKVRNPATDQIVDLRPIHPSLVRAKLDDTGEKVFLVTRLSPAGEPTAEPPQVLTTFEVMHIPGFGYDGLVGLAPLQIAAQTFGTAKAGDRLAARFFAKGTQLSGVINVKAPLADQEQADAIRRRWLQKSAGTSHAGEVAVLDAETSFQPLTIPPDSLQFLESRRWQTTEIARLFGIPPHLVGDVEKSTSWGTGIEQQNVGFVSYSVGGWTNRIEQRTTREVVATRGQYAKFDLNHLLRGDTSERFASYGLAIQWGWMTRNEARVKEDMEPIDGLDTPLQPLNMALSDQTSTEPPTAGMTSTTAPGSGQQQTIDEQDQNATS